MGTCASCGTELPEGARFCFECGHAVTPRACPSCGAPAERGRFCMSCGASLTEVASTSASSLPPTDAPPTGPVAERRLTSVLFGDLVGFTPLSENRDPEEVRELLSRYFDGCRAVIARYGGTVEKFIGDAVMAVWGVPTAHEDDAERAVRAGLDLLEWVTALGLELGAELALRVGIVTGEVAVNVGAVAEGMVAGDAVNTAARVQSAAEPGQLWVDDTTRSLTTERIAFADVGTHALKGKAEPVQLWHALGSAPVSSTGVRMDGLAAPLIGRTRELRLVKELFHATEESRRPRLLVVDGEAGVGKSRLVAEFERYIETLATTVMWHRGRCLSYGEGVAFWALTEAVRTRLGLSEADSGAVVAEQLDRGLEELVPDADERGWLRPRLAPLVGLSARTEFAASDLFTAWTTFFERIAQHAGLSVVLVIDDAHHADAGLRDFVDHLLGTAQEAILVVALARPELLQQHPAWGGRRCTVIHVEPLVPAEMSELVDELIDGLEPATREALVERAEGIPLFAIETVRALIDRDLVVAQNGRYVPRDGRPPDLSQIGAPASLQALVAARLDALSSGERRIVSDASVLGASFTREGLMALGASEPDLDSALESLQRKEIITVQRDRFSAERGQLRFLQAVVRQVAYATLSRRDRRSRHLAAAEHLTLLVERGHDLAAVVAQHLLDAVDASPEADDAVLLARAVALLERAAARARTLGVPTEALRHLQAALGRVTDPDVQGRLHTTAAEVAYIAGDYELAAEHAEQAVTLLDDVGDPIGAGVAAGAWGRALAVIGRSDEVLDIVEPRWQALQGVPGANLALIRLAVPLASAIYDQRHDADRASLIVDRRVLLAEGLGDPLEMANAAVNLGSRYQIVGGPRMAKLLYQESIRLGREHDLPVPWSNALLNLGTLEMSRDVEAARAHILEARELSERCGFHQMAEYAAGNYLTVLVVVGELSEAAALSDGYEFKTPQLAWGKYYIDRILAELLGQPEPDAAEPAAPSAAWSEMIKGQVRIMQMMREEQRDGLADEVRRTMVELQHAMGIDDDFMHFWPPLVRAALWLGDVDLAEHCMAPLNDATVGLISEAVAAHQLNLRGLVAAARGDDPVTVELDLRGAAAAFDVFGSATWAAQAVEDLAHWLVSQGRSEEARAELAAALQRYESIGAAGRVSRLVSWSAEHLAHAKA